MSLITVIQFSPINPFEPSIAHSLVVLVGCKLNQVIWEFKMTENQALVSSIYEGWQAYQQVSRVLAPKELEQFNIKYCTQPAFCRTDSGIHDRGTRALVLYANGRRWRTVQKLRELGPEGSKTTQRR